MSELTDGRPLVGLILAHQRRAWRTGSPALVETYLERQPALADDDDAVLDLIYNEVVLRAEAGESPAMNEYLERFPHLAHALELQFALEGVILPERRDGDEETLWNGRSAFPSGRVRPAIRGYEIHGEIGRGGMGVVYRALQLRLNRVVAVKMILSGAHAPPEAALRFLAEAEAVARLHHPNIVQIYALGDHEGHPYYEMEYAPGGSLAERLDGTPWPARDAARFVAVLGRAVREAHRLGIVHRDLKPANVLLAADGTPKVADFGLAKWLDLGSGLTGTDHIVGSPSYMAPEQAGGNRFPVGPAADVYSLGAILYELLTGRPPFRAASVLETLEQVKSAEPLAPTRLRPGLPRDLETICLKCLAKEPARRYADVDLLIDDLRRFESGEPVCARPVARWERAWRWCRREPALAALAAALVVGFVGVATQSWRAERYLRREIAAGRKLELAHRRSQERFELGLNAVGEYFTLVSEDELLKNPQLGSVREKLLARALEFYKRLQTSLERDPTPQARAQLAEAYMQVGSIQIELDLKPEGQASHERALALWEALVRANPDDAGSRSAAARAHVFVGNSQRARGQSHEALRSFERGLAIARELVRRHPGVVDFKRDLAWCLGSVGAVEYDRGLMARAVRSQAAVVAIREELVEHEPSDWLLRRELAWSLNDLALTLDAVGRPAEALAMYGRATGLWDDLARENSSDLLVRTGAVQSFVHSGDVLRTLGRWDEASTSYERGVALARALAGDHPASARENEVLAWSLNAAGALRAQGSRPQEGLRMLEAALAIRKAMLRDGHHDPERLTNVARTLCDLGKANEAAGRAAEGLRCFEEASEMCERLAHSNSADPGLRRVLAFCLTERGLVERRAGDPGALRSFERAVPLREAIAAERPESTIDQTLMVASYLHRATARAAAGRTDDALADIRKVEQTVGRSPSRAGTVLYNLACAYAQCSAGCVREATAAGADRRSEAARYEEKAVQALREAIARGYRYAALMSRDVDLEPLRARTDFQALVLDLSFPANPFVE